MNTKRQGVGTHLQGPHMTMRREGLKVGERTERFGIPHLTLTAARKAAKAGDCIVREDDRIVVSVKK